jgi:hypothetical protein
VRNLGEIEARLILGHSWLLKKLTDAEHRFVRVVPKADERGQSRGLMLMAAARIVEEIAKMHQSLSLMLIN